MNNQSWSFQAGIESAKDGRNINNSYPFNHDEFVAGYKSIKPESRTMLDKCTTPQERLTALKIIQFSKIG